MTDNLSLPDQYKRVGSVSFQVPEGGRMARQSRRSMKVADYKRAHSFGVFERKLEAPAGFYREKDKFYYLKKQYDNEPETLNSIHEMWNARTKYQIRRRFKWPPNMIWGTIFWSFGYYHDIWKEKHAMRLIGPDGKYVWIDEADRKDDSSDYDYTEHFPDNLDDLDWDRINMRYRNWKADQIQKRRSTVMRLLPMDGSGNISPNMMNAEKDFRDELDDIDFDALEAELLRRKSMGLPLGDATIKSDNENDSEPTRRKSSFQPRDPTAAIEVDEETITTVTTEYMVVKDPLKKKKSKSEKKAKKEAKRSRQLAEKEGKEDTDSLASNSETNVNAADTSRKSVVLPGLSQEESDRLWSAYNSADSNQSLVIAPVVTKTTTERKTSKRSLTPGELAGEKSDKSKKRENETPEEKEARKSRKAERKSKK